MRVEDAQIVLRLPATVCGPKTMKPNRVVRIAEQDESSRFEQALSYPRLEGLDISATGEQLLRQVVSGLISTEQALRDLRAYYEKEAQRGS